MHVLRLLYFLGCNGFEAAAKQQNLENVTNLDIPIQYGTIILTKCSEGYSKVSGLDYVICAKNRKFSGLSDIHCVGKY